MRSLYHHNSRSICHNLHHTSKPVVNQSAKVHDNFQHTIGLVKGYCADYFVCQELASSLWASPAADDQEMGLVWGSSAWDWGLHRWVKALPVMVQFQQLLVQEC
jgi:hypothetical protein